MKYRIITNGEKYRVQYRRFFWHSWKTYKCYCCRWSGIEKTTDFLKHEVDTILKELKQKHNKKWKPVKE